MQAKSPQRSQPVWRRLSAGAALLGVACFLALTSAQEPQQTGAASPAAVTNSLEPVLPPLPDPQLPDPVPTSPVSEPSPAAPAANPAAQQPATVSPTAPTNDLDSQRAQVQAVRFGASGPTPAPAASTPAATPRNEPLVVLGSPLQVPRTDYGAEGNRKAAQLRTQPPESFTFDRALLRDVLYFLADAAGLPFVSIPENAPQALQLVTFRMTASPFTALETLMRQNYLKLAFESGVWVARQTVDYEEKLRTKLDENELVGVMYQLRFDSADVVDFRADLAGQGAQLASGSASPTGSLGAGQGVTTPNLPLQNSQMVFRRRIPRLINDVRAIVGMPPLELDLFGNLLQGTSGQGAILDAQERFEEIDRKREDNQLAKTNSSAPPPDADKGDGGSSIGLFQPSTIQPLYIPPEKPQVIYNSDQNFLWVVATRKQHRWVAEYLTKVDKPQTLIAIEVKFLETKKNPQTDIGINWQNTLGTGLTVTGRASVGGDNIGGLFFTNSSGDVSTSTRLDSSQTGVGQSSVNTNGATIPGSQPFGLTTVISNLTSSENINARGVSGNIPYSAVLSLDQFSVTLQAFMQDRDTSIVQYPRVLTLNNREVAITSSENTPLNVGTATTGNSLGGANQTVGQLSYLPTGTQINILPKVVNANQIAMTVAITVSSIVGELPINLGTGSNLYPVTSERVYNASLQVDSGYTLAVGGLEKVADSNFEGGIPVLQNIPGLGYLFKNKNKKRDKVNLIIFITPYLIGDPAKTPGISETPQSIVPLRPGLPPQPPTFTPDGKLSGGEESVKGALDWLDFQLRYFRQVNLESLITRDSIEKLRDVIGVGRALLAYLQLEAGQPPYDPDTPKGRNVLQAEQMLNDLNVALATAQDNLM